MMVSTFEALRTSDHLNYKKNCHEWTRRESTGESGRERGQRWFEGRRISSHLISSIPGWIQGGGGGRVKGVQNIQRTTRPQAQLLRTNRNLQGSTFEDLMAPLQVFSIWHSLVSTVAKNVISYVLLI